MKGIAPTVGKRLVVGDINAPKRADGAKTVVAVQYAVHGTCSEMLGGEKGIERVGLHKGKRAHIPLAKSVGEPGIRTGLRRDCSVYVWVDVHRAIREGGIAFFQGASGIILCAGNEEGYIPKEYLTVIIELRDGESASASSGTLALAPL